MNHLTLKYVNPSYSNVAIPYLVLFDSDVLLKFDFDNKRMTIKNEAINLDLLQKNSKSSYFGSTNQIKNEKISELKTYFKNEKVFLNWNNLLMNNMNIEKVVNSINNNILKHENMHITTTTIEHCLINERNIDVFESWLFHVYSSTLLFNGNNNIKKAYAGVKSRDVDTQIRALCTTNTGRIPINASEKRILYALQLRKVRSFSDYLTDNKFELKDKVILYRLLFEGKGETLLSRKNDEFRSVIPESYINILKKVRTIDFQWAEHLMSKTSGWVSLYLDFSFDKYLKSKPDLSKSKFFDIYFQELSVIINKLRLDRGER
jgi:hypothetical protein